jgi:transcriptional regulator with XRE-family HTH domain
MNVLTWETTSAAGTMARAPMAALTLFFRPLYGSREVEGTAALRSPTEVPETLLAPLPQTSPGLVPPGPEEETKTSSAILELRRLSGLTWEQLANLFDVRRRTLHFWASGKPVNGPNEERLRRVLAAVRSTARGTAAGNRSLLLQECGGAVPFDLLARGEYGAFVRLVAAGPGRHDTKPTPRSRDAREARKPAPPDRLVGALQDRVHTQPGKTRPGRAVKVRRPTK